MSDGYRGNLAANVNGIVPGKFWPDTVEPILYQRSVNLVAGPSGVGKSLIEITRVAHLSRTLGPVIYCNAEDDTMMQRYRLEAAGADLKRVRLANFDVVNDLWELEECIRFMGAVYVSFDTAEKHISAPVQRWARPLTDLVKVLNATDCTATFVHHTNKNVKKNADWRAAIGGATAGLIGTARSISLVGKRPDDATQVVLCPVKDSYDETPKAIAFEFASDDMIQSNGETIEVSYLRIAEKGITISEPTLLVHVAGDNDSKRGPSPEKAAEAAEFITNALANGARSVKDTYRCLGNPDSDKAPGDPDWSSRLCGHKSIKDAEVSSGTGVCPDCSGPMVQVVGLETDAENAGVSWATVKRAKKAIDIVTARKGFGSGGVFYWTLPDGHPSLVAGSPEHVA